MLRRWLHALLCLTLLSTAVASAWACPQLSAWTEQAMADAGCPHHRQPASPDALDDSDVHPGKAQCCCPAPLQPELSLATLARPLAASPPRWNEAPPRSPVVRPPLRPPASSHP